MAHKTHDEQVEPLLTDEPKDHLDDLAGDYVRFDRHTVQLGMSLGGFDHRREAMVRSVLFFLDLIDARWEQRELLDHDHVELGRYSLGQLDCRLERPAAAG